MIATSVVRLHVAMMLKTCVALNQDTYVSSLRLADLSGQLVQAYYKGGITYGRQKSSSRSKSKAHHGC